MVNKPFITKLIKKNGRLVFKSRSDLDLFNELVSKLREGQVIEQMTMFDRDDGTLTQLACVHAMIATLADEIGETKSAVKLRTKKECGLMDIEGNPKSFAVCSKQELNDVREYLIEKGDFIGVNLR